MSITIKNINNTSKDREHIPANSTIEQQTTIENRNRANRQPLKTFDQVTLQGLSRANPWLLKDMEDRNGISLHGPFYQDLKLLLTITGRHQPKRWKVTQLSDETVRILHLNVANPPSFHELSRADTRILGIIKARNGIFILGSFHQDLKCLLQITEKYPRNDAEGRVFRG